MALYVVSGATGRVGSSVAEQLLSRGDRIRVIVRREHQGVDWLQRGAEIAVGSLDDEDFLSGALQNATNFFTLLPENVTPDDFHGARRRMADAIANAVGTTRLPHVAMLSAIAAVLPDGNGPAADLHYLENRLRASGARVSVLRACFFQDNVAGLVPLAAAHGIYPNFLGSADAAFPMIAARDVGRLVGDAMASPPTTTEVVDLLGPVYSVRHIAQHLGAALGKTIQVVDIPPERHIQTLVQSGVPQQLAEAVAEMFAAFSAGRIVPQGNRRLMGTTTLDRVVDACVQGSLAAHAAP